MEDSQRFSGIVREFSISRGIGTIEMDGSNEPVVVRYSAIRGTGLRNLRAGQRVSFELEQGLRGLSALRVVGE
jgi:CspA family cold shock protein